MSNAHTSFGQLKSTFTPPAYDQPHVYRQFEEIIGSVTQVVSRVWPLKDYIAINPYAGITNRDFADARAFLKVFSDCELLMPIEYYRSQFEKGKFGIADIRDAIADIAESDSPIDVSLEAVLERLETTLGDETAAANPESLAAHRPVRTIAEITDQNSATHWGETILDEISKFCSAHYDQSQSAWTSPWKHLPVYQAWRSAAIHDRNPEILGLKGFRNFVAALPHTPDAAIVELLCKLRIPKPLWESFLLCQVFSMPGWCAWAKYQDHADAQTDLQHLVGLIAARLAYDAALADATGLAVKWDSMSDTRAASFRSQQSPLGDDSDIRMALLRASEIGYRNRMLAQLTTKRPPSSGRKLAQMVFCIDVRSERIRRQLESLSPEIETFGFAGFFGMPIEYVRLGQTHGDNNVPALIKPSFRLYEGCKGNHDEAELKLIEAKKQSGLWASLWRRFQKSAVGCFSFVETTGVLYSAKLIANTVVRASAPAASSCEHTTAESTGPTLRGLNRQGWTTSRQTDLAESMLRNLGLTQGFARLVVLCGHASQTKNNPLAAGLDCGACGGHSGEPNARFAALLLNQPFIRELLQERGIDIPDDTFFMAGLHNTTTDQIEWFDLDGVPNSHREDVQELIDHARIASTKTRQERTPLVGGQVPADLLRRAMDWSEVRPEWGLAGNAAFLVGPRWMTKNMNLDGRMFLHSYDHEGDPQGAILENIMTAPMVVAHWINMQYYASTVDNRHFGSGDKTVHNVVGGFGILSGNAGDLMTGLPTQSLHDGKQFQHLPTRLQVVIAAPRDAIETVIEKYPAIKDLIENQWLHLTAVDDGIYYHYRKSSLWCEVDTGNAQDVVAS